MKTLEYDNLSFRMTCETRFANMQASLNTKGAEGWEVVSISSSKFANVGYTDFLKRETTDGGAAS